MINSARLKATLLEMLKIESLSNNERLMCDYLKSVFSNLSLQFIEDGAAEKLNGNSGNLVVYIKSNLSSGSSLPTILLNAHIDTVTLAKGANPILEDDIIKTDGTTALGGDDKAGVAVIIEVVRTLIEQKLQHGNLVLVFTVCEELGLRGVKNLDFSLLKNVDFGYALDCTGSAGTIYIESPSHDTIKAEIFGKSAHAGIEPEKGINAIQIASKAIARMKIGRIDDETTANIGIISGGKATNIVPDSVVLDGEARSHNETKLQKQVEHMIGCIKKAAAKYAIVPNISVTREYSHYKLEQNMPVIKRAFDTANKMTLSPSLLSSGGGSDANIFNNRGIPVVPLGCALDRCHSTEEQISIKELTECANYVLNIVGIGS